MTHGRTRPTRRDPVPFEDFVVSRGPALLRFALMLCGDPGRAEDLVQTVLAKAYPRWRRITGLDHPDAYVRTMLVNEHTRWWQRRSSREVPTEPADLRAGTVDGPAVSYAARDAAWELLRRLPDRQRAVLVLRYYEDLPDSEVAAVLGVSPSTVRSQAVRGLAALRAAIPTMDQEALP